ncbi:MAG: sporulation integral membrane protein YtvI [Firmicutes bacterium]|nr:sporulation integral membrane protein YtvI [Bacillota bacterium]
MSNYAKAAIATAALLVFVYIAVRFVLPLFTPFVVAVILAALIDPVVNLITRRLKVSRGVAVLAVLIVAGVVLGVLVSIGIAELILEIDQLSKNLGALDKSLGQVLEDLIARATRVFESLPGPIADTIRANQGRVFAVLESIVISLSGMLRSLPQVLLVFVVSLVSTFFVSRDKEIIGDFIFQAMPRAWQKQLRRVRRELLSAFIGYIRALFVLLSITATLSIVGLSILGVNYAWLLGIAAGLLDVIPLIGPSALYLPWAAYHFTAGNIGFGIGLLVVLSSAALVRQLAEARVIGRNIGLHPLAALVSVYAGIRLFGVKGFFVGPLTVIFLKAILTSLILPMFPLDGEPRP